MAIWDRSEAAQKAAGLHSQGKTIVFTNGCFDLLHRGHVEYLQEARSKGDILIVGLNSDASVTYLKGSGRPVQKENDRAVVLDALAAVDVVVIFEEENPAVLIREIQPEILVKGGDYQVEDVSGADIVLARGGDVKIISFRSRYSTTAMLEKWLMEKP